MEQYSEDWLKLVNNEVHISPLSAQQKYRDETFDLLIVGKTSGNSQALLPAKFEFQKLNIPEGLSGPKFELAPTTYNINYGFDSSGIDNSPNYDVQWLPKIIDENERKIMKIDPTTIKAKKGSDSNDLKFVDLKEGFIDFRCWGIDSDGAVDESCKLQHILLATTDETDSGLY